MQKSLLLNQNWDICLNSNGDFSFTDDNYAIAQNVACACRAFTKDMYFNQEDGIPHFFIDISNPQTINTTLLAHYFEKEALKFPQITSAVLDDIHIENRVIHGQLVLTLKNGETLYVTI